MSASICSLKHPKICKEPWELSLQQIPTCLHIHITGPWSIHMRGSRLEWWRQVRETPKQPPSSLKETFLEKEKKSLPYFRKSRIWSNSLKGVVLSDKYTTLGFIIHLQPFGNTQPHAIYKTYFRGLWGKHTSHISKHWGKKRGNVFIFL